MRVSPIARLRRWTRLCLTTFAVLTGTAAPALAQPVPAVTEYYHLDALGSTRVVTSQTGAVLRHYEFGPFGGQDSQCTQSPDKRLFTGQVRDKETCLDYFGARHMRSTFGRFLAIDPALDTQTALVDPQQWNRYAYARNNPMKFTDPDGRNPVVVGAAIGAAVYGGWQVYQNWSQGRPWYENVGVEATTGMIIGATLGVAAPVVAATPAAEMGVLTAGGAGAAANASWSSAYEIAAAGGRHAGFLQGYAARSPREIARAIRSYERVIAEHESWIKDPSLKIGNLASRAPGAIARLVNEKWPGDIRRNRELLEILRELQKRPE